MTVAVERKLWAFGWNSSTRHYVEHVGKTAEEIRYLPEDIRPTVPEVIPDVATFLSDFSFVWEELTIVRPYRGFPAFLWACPLCACAYLDCESDCRHTGKDGDWETTPCKKALCPDCRWEGPIGFGTTKQKEKTS